MCDKLLLYVCSNFVMESTEAAEHNEAIPGYFDLHQGYTLGKSPIFAKFYLVGAEDSSA